MQGEKNVCALCNNVAEKRCGACETVYYCSRDHQTLHWKSHSKNCRAYKLVENSQLGRHYVATRNIKVGETVMHDKAPLITKPEILTFTKLENGKLTAILLASPKCLSCYVQLTAGNAKPCVKCGWPLCLKCTKHGTECEFTMKHRGSKVNISEREFLTITHPAYEIIGVIRALALRENDPKSYRKLMKLQHLPSQNTQVDHGDSISKAARFAKTFFNINDVQESDIRKIMRIALINGRKVMRTSTTHEYSAVYDVSSYVEHNCKPNCSMTFTDEGGVIVWAAVPISKGDHITSSYLPLNLGTMERRKTLADGFFFECECERCKDPTEFGTMFSAIKCHTEKCDGSMLPPTFLVSKGSYPDFVCSKCSARTPWMSVVRTNEEISTHWKSVANGDYSQCENFLAKWQKVLHENNFQLIEAEFRLVDLIMVRIASASAWTKQSDQFLADVVKRCKKLTKFYKTLMPAENRIRGIVLFMQSRVNTQLLSRTHKVQGHEKLELMKEHESMLNEIYQLLHREAASNNSQLYPLIRTVLFEMGK